MNNIIIEEKEIVNYKANLLDCFIHANARTIELVLYHDNVREVIETHGELQGYIMNKYSSYYFNTFHADKNSSIGTMSTLLTQTWFDFLQTYNDNLYKMYKALTTEYEPLNNYDKNSSITTEFVGKENELFEMLGVENNKVSIIGSEKDKNVKTGSVEMVTPEVSTMNVIANEETNIFSPKDKIITSESRSTTNYNSVTDENTKSFTGRENNETKSFEDRKNKNTKDFENRKNIVTETTKGNIGVTTSQEMLESEMLLRSKWNFVSFVVDTFVYLTCTPE